MQPFCPFCCGTIRNFFSVLCPPSVKNATTGLPQTSLFIRHVDTISVLCVSLKYVIHGISVVWCWVAADIWPSECTRPVMLMYGQDGPLCERDNGKSTDWPAAPARSVLTMSSVMEWGGICRCALEMGDYQVVQIKLSLLLLLLLFPVCFYLSVSHFVFLLHPALFLPSIFFTEGLVKKVKLRRRDCIAYFSNGFKRTDMSPLIAPIWKVDLG